MSYPQYTEDLYAIYKSEVMGEALFNVAAILTFATARKQKWRLLVQLETQTKQRYLSFVQAQGQSPKYPLASKLTGTLFGVLFGLLPWRAAMKMLGSGTGPVIEVFSRLDQPASEAHKEFFSYVLAHERAIENFAQKELANEPEGSSQQVEALLEG